MKLSTIDDLIQIKTKYPFNSDYKIAFISGNFNVLHAGHLRLINFAKESADLLIVSVNDTDSPDIFVPFKSRIEALFELSKIDYVVRNNGEILDQIALLRPDFVIKGKEFEFQENIEYSALVQYGGELLFSSGEVFSSTDFSYKKSINTYPTKFSLPLDYLDRHNISYKSLNSIIDKFSKLNAIVIGDLIIDEYVFCEPLGLSREDPTIVVTPVSSDKYLGGAGIVSSHMAGLGANVDFVSVVGDDENHHLSLRMLDSNFVKSKLFVDPARPTTLKQRIKCHNKTLLRMSVLRQNDISNNLAKSMLNYINSIILNCDLIVFSDFNYGCLPQFLVDSITEIAKNNNIPIFADSQSSSQIGDISRFKSMNLITPTEYEARISTLDSKSGLAALTLKLSNKCGAKHIFTTIGSEGFYIHSGDKTDQLPALNKSPVDVAGAGDCLLAASALSLASGSNIWESAAIGSCAAAFQTSTIGNRPITINDLKKTFN
jgi:rfaE bifunctional protein kinase chain/domain